MFNYKFLKALKEAGLTQKQLAQKINMQEARISNIINGLWNPLEEEKRKIEKVLDRKVWRYFQNDKKVNDKS